MAFLSKLPRAHDSLNHPSVFSIFPLRYLFFNWHQNVTHVQISTLRVKGFQKTFSHLKLSDKCSYDHTGDSLYYSFLFSSLSGSLFSIVTSLVFGCFDFKKDFVHATCCKIYWVILCSNFLLSSNVQSLRLGAGFLIESWFSQGPRVQDTSLADNYRKNVLRTEAPTEMVVDFQIAVFDRSQLQPETNSRRRGYHVQSCQHYLSRLLLLWLNSSANENISPWSFFKFLANKSCHRLLPTLPILLLQKKIGHDHHYHQ